MSTSMDSDVTVKNSTVSSGGIHFEQPRSSLTTVSNTHTLCQEKLDHSTSKEAPTEYLYIAMELCPKGTLKEWLEKTPVREEAACVKLFRQICCGVAYIQQQGLTTFLDKKS